jgi:hypothetical protein
LPYKANMAPCASPPEVRAIPVTNGSSSGYISSPRNHFLVGCRDRWHESQIRRTHAPPLTSQQHGQPSVKEAERLMEPNPERRGANRSASP